MINVGIVGVGYWGPNFARLCYEVEGVNLSWIADLDENALKKINRKYPSVQTTKDYHDLLKDLNLDAVIITTPAQTHFSVAKDFLSAKKHILIEKPLTANLTEARKLKQLVEKNKTVFMVDHTFKYNPSIQKLKELIDKGELGKIYYIIASYSALGPIRRDVDALWDLGPHWIYTLNYLLGAKPLFVEAKGGEYLKSGMKDVVFINLEFPKNILANIHITWVYPKKDRSIAIVGDKKMAIFDDVSQDARLVIYDRGISVNSADPNFANLQIILRDGDIVIPRVENKEPLKECFKHFLECIKENKKPLSDIDDGLEVVEILEKISLSMKKNNVPILV